MANPLSDNTLAQVHKIAAQISVTHDLDPEIQAELRTHIEEKIMAYLSGEEKLSDADAVNLAQAHFGNSATITSLFRRTYRQAQALSLFRRLAAATIASCLVITAGGILWSLFFIAILSPGMSATHASSRLRIALGMSIPLELCNIIALWAIFAWVRRRLATGRCAWLYTWSPFTLGLMAIGCWCLTSVSFGLSAGSASFPAPTITGALAATIVASSCIFFAGTFFLWLWWCDRPRASVRTLVAIAACWFILFPPVNASRYLGLLVGARAIPLQNIVLTGDWQALRVFLPMLYDSALLAAALIAYILYRRRHTGTLLVSQGAS